MPHAIHIIKNRGDVIRTRDFYVPNVALYQTEPHPANPYYTYFLIELPEGNLINSLYRQN